MIGRLETLRVTVYLAEDRYGQFSIGSQAAVSVDSYRGETFNDADTHVADRVEYTPRDVQKSVRRRSTPLCWPSPARPGSSSRRCRRTWCSNGRLRTDGPWDASRLTTQSAGFRASAPSPHPEEPHTPESDHAALDQRSQVRDAHCRREFAAGSRCASGTRIQVADLILGVGDRRGGLTRQQTQRLLEWFRDAKSR